MKKNLLSYIATAAVGLTLFAFSSCNLQDVAEPDIPALNFPEADAAYELSFLKEGTTNPFTNDLKITIEVQSRGGLPTDQPLFVDLANKKVSFDPYLTVKNGYVAFQLNPNIKLSASNPVEFVVKVASPDDTKYEIAFPRPDKQTAKMVYKYTYEVTDWGAPVLPSSRKKIIISNTTNEFKVEGITGAGTLYQKDVQIPYGLGYVYVDRFRVVTKGSFKVTMPTPVLTIEDFGIYASADPTFVIPMNRERNVNSTSFYTLKKEKSIVSGEIRLNIASAIPSSAAINYTIESPLGVSYTGQFVQTFPYSVAVPNIMVPTSNQTVKIKLTTNSPYTITSEIANVPINGTANATLGTTLAPDDAYCTVNFTGKTTASKPTLIKPSIRFEFRQKGESDWQFGEFISGTCKVYMKTNKEYEIRIYLNNQWYTYNFTTDPSLVDKLVADNPEIEQFEVIRDGNNYTINCVIASSEFDNYR